MTDRTQSPPLSGIRVIDFTTFLSGPFCTQILGDLGAEVIKVEPFAGDSSRSIPPYFVGEDSAYYLSTNRNKKSVAVNLKAEDGCRIARSLIAKADVVIENFRPGVMEKLGLPAEALCEQHPALIWASITGFGQTGPWKDQPAYDMIVQALSGVMSMTGEVGRQSVRLGIPAGDIIAGMYTAIAINGALFDRSRTGLGRRIDVSMLDGQLSMLSYQGQYHLVGGAVPDRQGARHDSIPTYRSFLAGDGRELVVTANTQTMWSQMAQALGLPELVDDPRFADAKSRLVNKEELWPLLENAFQARSAEEWVTEFVKRSVPAALIKNVPEAIEDARCSGRSMVVELQNESGDSLEVVGSPIKMEGHEMPMGYPPALSENLLDCLGGLLDMPESEIAALMEAGVLLAPNNVKDGA
jgi:crotonobetainyl-CoA:carnitine CoA-transferase CaiB-like acyl-CoA transferase